MTNMIALNSQAVTNYIAANHTTKCALIGGGLCAIAAAELAVRVLHNLYQVVTNDPARHHQKFGETVSRNFGGMVLFGACATNAIPGLAALGAIVLIGNAFLSQESDDALVITKATRALQPIAREFGNTAWNITKDLASAAWNLTSAFFETIGNIVKNAFKMIDAILRPIGRVLGTLFSAAIPKTRESVAAVAVVASIVIYRFCIRRA